MSSSSSSDLLQFTSKGIWCPAADVYIDPWKPVKKAMITHGHSDHSRYGHEAYLCTETAAPAIRYRLGDIRLQTIEFGQTVQMNGVKFSFHPAGHILGSAQIRVEYQGEVWVASGDYKLEDDGLAEAFEPVRCDTFITESTFGLPVFDWRPQESVFADINQWWRSNAEAAKVSLITAYSLGKAQRLLRGLDTSIGQIFTHGAVENINEVMREQGVTLPDTIRVVAEHQTKDFPGHLVVAPPSAINSSWSKKFKPLEVAIASGWMTLRGARRRRAVGRGFVLSDHVDWKDLNRAVAETGASRVIVTHGYTGVYTKYLRQQGLDAQAAETEYTGESLENTTEDAAKGETQS
ncbi:MAG: ligase-associated DNA damage response exonuclease [Bacteroidota bacterium]